MNKLFKLKFSLEKKSYNFLKYLNWKLGRYDEEAVYFYTFHKCASTLFSSYVLKMTQGLYHIDYADKIFRGTLNKKIDFSKNGVVYGPIRLSTPDNVPGYKLVDKVCKPNFIMDKRAIFFVRDPRDILVSSYYSFGYTHGLSSVEEIRRKQIEQRKYIQKLSLDEYVVDSAFKMNEYFANMIKLNEACKDGVVVKYEDMVNNWDIFRDQMVKSLKLDKKILKNIYEMSRPKKKEDKTSHQRSGKSGGYKKKLKKETIKKINEELSTVLKYFDYEI